MHLDSCGYVMCFCYILLICFHTEWQRLCFHLCSFAWLFICLLATLQKTDEWIFKKQVRHDIRNNLEQFWDIMFHVCLELYGKTDEWNFMKFSEWFGFHKDLKQQSGTFLWWWVQSLGCRLFFYFLDSLLSATSWKQINRFLWNFQDMSDMTQQKIGSAVSCLDRLLHDPQNRHHGLSVSNIMKNGWIDFHDFFCYYQKNNVEHFADVLFNPFNTWHFSIFWIPVFFSTLWRVSGLSWHFQGMPHGKIGCTVSRSYSHDI